MREYGRRVFLVSAILWAFVSFFDTRFEDTGRIRRERFALTCAVIAVALRKERE